MVIPPDPGGGDPLFNLGNTSEDLLLAWLSRSLGNTPAGVDDLVHNVIRHPKFDPSLLENFNAVTAIRRFEKKWVSKPGAALKVGDGWKEASVSIRVPCTGVKQQEGDAPEFIVEGILYRDIIEVITAELKDPDTFHNIHVAPHKEWWNPGPREDPVRVYSEIYNSDAMLEADADMRRNLDSARGLNNDSARSPNDNSAHGLNDNSAHGPNNNLETFIVSALLYSDSTHLAQFGNASLWPIYLFLGNVSKYICSKPTSFTAHHIAYIPTVS